jgi:beta-1,4-mannosyl-glycoprotein beta-1,4-N-acetylglucosaminyltransferase
VLYDCVIFFNELDLLELRLTELDRIVDKFVIAEAPVTFSGIPKSLIFERNRGRFDRWKDRIIHVVVDDMPAGSNPWVRERHQRNAILRGLGSASGNDGIMISDVDEIPRAGAVCQWRPELGACRFRQMLCYYWINCVDGEWLGSKILPFRELHDHTDINAIRSLQCPAIDNGGWHFSFLGGSTAIKEKLEAYSHQELNTQRFKSERYLRTVLSLGVDLFNRPNHEFKFCDLDDRFPACVLEGSRFDQFICKARFHENWYPTDQLLRLSRLCESVGDLSGAVLEIGCWEGRSTVALARASHPEVLVAIDTWLGNLDEDPRHSSVSSARERDIFAQFKSNIAALTEGNVAVIRDDCHNALRSWHSPVKFAHIDASHDYCSVSRTVEALRRFLVPGGILCGDDFVTASAGRDDLKGGVERAVREQLDGFKTANNFWWWQQLKQGTTDSAASVAASNRGA